eukprot:1319920-Rhodomonas_salina.2
MSGLFCSSFELFPSRFTVCCCSLWTMRSCAAVSHMQVQFCEADYALCIVIAGISLARCLHTGMIGSCIMCLSRIPQGVSDWLPTPMRSAQWC